MENTSPDELAGELLENCLAGQAVRQEALSLLASQAASETPAIAAAASRALFRGLVEPLADRFDTALCDAYVSVFARVIERVRPGWQASAARARYQRIRQPRHYTDLPRHPERVFVLSRVTLGADVAITSVVLDAVKKRFPEAEIYFVGGRKGWELFEADPRVRHLPLVYGRASTLGQRIDAGEELAETLSKLPGLVVDPDSRLTQLGLMPVCD
ncbi:MAG: glycosyltransferase family 9 protein, partial [bacterium]|nr:glycosyltransferase family 9 protein [bacterium]